MISVYQLNWEIAMPFQKQHKHGAKKILESELDDQPICFRGWKGQKERLKTVQDLQEQFRRFAEQLISASNEQDSCRY